MDRADKERNARDTVLPVIVFGHDLENKTVKNSNTKQQLILLLLLPLIVSLVAASNKREDEITSFTQNYLSTQLDSLSLWAEQMKTLVPIADENVLHTQFIAGRLLYKRIEFLTEYYFPASAAKLNGAPLMEAEPSENLEPKKPQGLQVLEAIVYDDLTGENRKLIYYETDNIIRTINKLKSLTGNLEPNEAELLDALRLNIYTMIIKGISGFDAPEALSGLEEAQENLRSLIVFMQRFSGEQAVITQAQKAINYINTNKRDFNSFDRAQFIRNYINPLCSALYDYQVKAKVPFVQAERAIHTDSRTLFDEHTFNLYFFAPAGTTAITDAQVQLGKKLFFEKRLSANNSRSCGSCHKPEKAFTDGLRVNETLGGDKHLLRNTPTLINAALQPSQFYDSRISFLEDQIHDVVTNRAEMDGNLASIAKKLANQKEYRKLSSEAYGAKLTPDIMRKSLAAYIRSLTRMNSPFDRYMRGDSLAMNTQAIRGFNLFMGKAKCGTCHFMPLFNGAAPPFYQKIESEVLGVPAENDTLHADLDSDSGKYHLYKIPHQLFSFKTVTVRNAEHTAPYMHNGVFKTLDEVIAFYDRGGGAGIGIDLNNQTLAPDRLQLSKTEKQYLVAFIKTLSDN